MTSTELCQLTACQQKARFDRGQTTATELLEAHLRQIEQANPDINAVITLDAEAALEQAFVIDRKRTDREPLGPLAGLPMAHKDLTLTKGMRTTFGSPRFKDFIPSEDSALVRRLRNADVVTLGKTNTPEWGAGSQTFNTLFGATRNPFDPTKTSGGSSGGAAAALAARMLPLCDGSDLGGSLRNPASFCHVVGLRPSPGRVSSLPTDSPWNDLSVVGPMARTVDDCALLLSAIAGPDARSPISINEPGDQFFPLTSLDTKQIRVAFSPDFDGQFPFQPEVITATKSAEAMLLEAGCQVTSTCINFEGADKAFEALRSISFHARHKEGIAAYPDQYKDTVKWNAAQAEQLSAEDIREALSLRSALGVRCASFFEHFDFLVLPVAQVLPFDIETEWVTAINDVTMEHYISWMKSCYVVSLMGTPALSLPFTFSVDGLPVGLQIVAPWGQDLRLLQFAKALEEMSPYYYRSPSLS